MRPIFSLRAGSAGTALALFASLGCTGVITEPIEGSVPGEGSGATPGAGAAPSTGATGGSTASGGRSNPGTGGSSGNSTGGSNASGGASGTSGSAGSSGTGSDPLPPGTTPVCPDNGVHLGSAPIRRLSGHEYLNTLSDLFPGVAPELPVLPIEDPVDSFENDARALGPSDLYVSRWEEIAYRYTTAVTENETALAEFLPCAADAADAVAQKACGAELVESFGLLTHRRELTTEEKTRYQTLFDTQLAAIDFAAAVQLTSMAMLQSPWFLYRVEPARSGSNGLAALDSWEMASRLSYFLWQSTPDEALLERAAAGTLTEDTSLESEIRRMLADPRARKATVDFHRQWLYFDRILKEEHATRVDAVSPNWTAATQASAREELLRFTERTLFDGDGTLSSLFLSRETSVDSLLADIYGVSGPTEAGTWQNVTLPETERAGILTRVGFLAAHAHSANGSPPLRGNFIVQRLFCQVVDPPPPGTDTSLPDEPGDDLTNREIFEQKTSPATCRGCHSVLNGFGFALEAFDAAGAYRATDNGQDVDATATLDGTDVTGVVNGAVELSERVVASEQVNNCALSRWVRYASGRGVEMNDQCALARLNEAFTASGGNIVELMVSIATSPEFRNRPPESP